MLEDLSMFLRFAAGLRHFLRRPLTAQQARESLLREVRDRESRFLLVTERAVLRRPDSPFCRLLAHAGVEQGDLRELVQREGVEGALERLLAAGVYLTFDEFKGRHPIVRGSLRIDATAADFDNPLLVRHFEAATGGSGGVRRRLTIDLHLLEHDAAAYLLMLEAFDIASRPTALWRPVPPGAAGIKRALDLMKIRVPLQRWFTQSDPALSGNSAKSWAFLWTAIGASRLWANGMPVPEHVPLQNAGTVARWLAEMHHAGTPAHLDTNVSSAVRVCQAAESLRLDISGAFFRVGGEPLTSSRVAVFRAANCRVTCNYSLSEAGPVGIACADPVSPDDVHIDLAKMAVVQNGGDALYLTTLHPASPKLMLNVQSGDEARLATRDCGCVFGDAGFRQHLSHIRSFEKLTSEGMQFLASDISDLVESVLPDRFGGNPTDYQLVERDLAGLPQVSVLVHPRLGPVDDAEVAGCVLERLGSNAPGARMMSDRLRQAGTLRVERREPYSTPAAKILALHVIRE